MESPVQIRIKSKYEVQIGLTTKLSDDSLAYFKFQITSHGETWYINCGIQDFVELHEQLLKNFPRLAQSFDFIKKKFSSKHFEKLREEQLEMYFQTIAADPELIVHPILKNFLRIFDPSTPVLSLTILRADYLSDKEKGVLRGYCEVYLSDKDGREVIGKTDYTRIIEDSSRAKWRNEQFKFLLVPDAHCINIIFWEKAGLQGFSFVRKRGSITVPLATIPKNKSTSHWFPIEDMSGKGKTTCGEIKLELKLQVPKDWTGPSTDDNKHVSHYHEQNVEAFKEQQVLRREIRDITEKLQKITELKLKLKYRAPKGEWPGCLFVTLLDASDIMYRDVGPINPFFVLTLLGESKKTQPKFNSPAPSFHHVFQFVIPHTVPFNALRLHVALWQKNDLTRQTLLASAHVPLVDHIPHLHKTSAITIGLCAPAPIEMLTTQQKGLQMKAMGYRPKWPILAIPGLVSSALAVEEGKKEWTGERVWISLEKLGKHKVKLLTLNSANSLREWEKNVNEKVRRISSLFESDKTKSSEEIKVEEVDVKPRPDPFLEQQWIQHMSLADDGYSDPPGIKVRPVKGREGVSFLADDSIPSFIRKHTYVMGPTMSNLAAIGYNEDNLVAFPYDWRLPLPHLETRDKVFTELKATIERMVKKNNMKIVILAHSMGNRIIHYFLNIMVREEGGQQWIDDHIHSLFAVASPWLGAPKMARGMISGERMGLDMFLRSRQAVEIVKTHGGFPSLLPIGLKNWFDDRSKRFMYFDMGTPITDDDELDDSSDSDLEDEKEIGFKKNFILSLFKRGKTQPHQEPAEQSSKVSFVNVTEFDQDDKKSRKRRVKRHNSAKDSNEGGVKKRRRSASGYDSEKELKSPITSDNETALVFSSPTTPVNSEPSSPRRSRRKVSRSGSFGDKGKELHNNTNTAHSDNDDVDEIVPQNEKKGAKARRLSRNNSNGKKGLSSSGSFSANNNTNVASESLTDSSGNVPSPDFDSLTRVKTLPFKTELKKTRSTSDSVRRVPLNGANNVNFNNEELPDNDDKHFHHTEEPILIINKPGTNKPISQYQGVSIKKALLTAGFERQYNHLEDRRKDKFFGGHGDLPSVILEPPPVSKIFAVYGVNVDTEKVYFYRKDTQKNRYVLDKRINGVLDEYPGYVFIKGVGWETEDAPQKVIEQRTGFVGTRSGDGTVPYESLSYCHNWRGKVKDLSIIELPKAEHRAIVCTANFFEILVDYVCEKTTGDKDK